MLVKWLVVTLCIMVIWAGCSEPKPVPNIKEIASNSLVHLTIECPEDSLFSMAKSSGGVIGNGLVITDNLCADRGVWGVVRTLDGVEYEVESVVDTEGNLIVLKVRGLKAPALTIARPDTPVPDKMFIAAIQNGESMEHTIGEHTVKATFGLRRSLDYGWIRADTSRYMGSWRGGIVLNYKGELIGIVNNHVARRPGRAFITSMGQAVRLSY